MWERMAYLQAMARSSVLARSAGKIPIVLVSTRDLEVTVVEKNAEKPGKPFRLAVPLPLPVRMA